MSAQGSVLEAGAVLDDRYHIRSEVAALDVGTLYEAYDLQSDRPVDVLVFAFRAGDQPGPLVALEQSQQSLAELASDTLVPYEHIGVVAGYPFLVRRHVEAESLADLLSRQGPLSVEGAVCVAIGLCETLSPAHRAGLVHGSLSPSSVWLVEGIREAKDAVPEIVLTDVGLLPALRPLQSAPGQPWGRTRYLTPEQAAGEAAHSTSDVYAIGSLFYAMLAGRPPFRSSDSSVQALQHLRQEPPSLQILVPEVPSPLAEIVEKALSKEPAARYRNAGQLAQILRTQLRIPSLLTSRPPAPIITQPAEGARLMVPAPSRSRRPPVPPVVRNYEFIDDRDWAEPRGGVDWLMAALFVAAILAVLGLLPLWRTVYERYSAPPALPTPTSLRLPSLEPGWFVDTDEAGQCSEAVPPLALDVGRGAADCCHRVSYSAWMPVGVRDLYRAVEPTAEDRPFPAMILHGVGCRGPSLV
ncbi:MAG: serine/threonine protein kinase [Anaerolineae bacterium]